jgi:hypothetical protein
MSEFKKYLKYKMKYIQLRGSGLNNEDYYNSNSKLSNQEKLLQEKSDQNKLNKIYKK